MGIGPAYAIPMALRNAGITVDDVDLFEVLCIYLRRRVQPLKHGDED